MEPSLSRAPPAAQKPRNDDAEEAPENFPKNVVIFMDALEEFSIETLEWVLKNVVLKSCCTLTIIGLSPYLNIPLYAKTWSGIWSVDSEDLKERREWRNDPKYQKVQYLMDLCESYGIMPVIRTEMGHPLRRRVMELIISLQATLVVFDEYHDRKNIEYYTKRVPYNMVIMTQNGEVDLIKGRSQINSSTSATPGQSPLSLPPTPKLKISDGLKRFLDPIIQRSNLQSS